MLYQLSYTPLPLGAAVRAVITLLPFLAPSILPRACVVLLDDASDDARTHGASAFTNSKT